MKRAGSAAATLVLLVLALAAGAALNPAQRHPEVTERPFARTGAIGSTVDARAFEVTVEGVRGAAKISNGAVHDTGGIWIIVSIKLVGRDKPVSVAYAAVLDANGREYRATERVSQPLVDGGWLLEPAVPVTGEIAFEVPPGVATGLTLYLAKNGFDQRMDAMAEVPLKISANDVRQWSALPDAVHLKSPEVAS